MADDNIIRVGTSVDTSGLKSGMAAATDAVSRAVVDLKTQYDQLTARGKELRAVLSSNINPAALETVREEASQLALQQAVLKAQLDLANKSLREQAAISAGLAPSIQQLAAAEAAQAEEARQAALESARLAEAREAEAAANEAAAEAAAAAAAVEAAAAREAAEAQAALAVNTTEARFAAQLLGREMGVPLPRALSSIAAQSSVLGPILEAAFPVIAIGAFVAIIGEVVTKVIDLYHAWDSVYQAQQRALTEGIRLAKEFHKEISDGQKAILDEAERVHGKTYAAGLKFGNKQLDVNEAQRDIDRIEGLIKAAQGRINAGTTSPFTTTKGSVRPGIPDKDAQAAQADVSRLNDELENAQQRKKNALFEERALSAEVTKAEVEDQKKLSEEQQQAAAAAKRAYSEAEQAARQANTNAMTDLETRATQEGTIGRALSLQKIALLSQEIAADHAYTDVVRQLSAERARVGAEAAAQGVQNFNKAQQLASASIAAFSAETRRANEEEAKYFDQMLKERIKSEEKQLEADKAFLAEDSNIKTGNLQTEKVATESKQKLAPPDLSLRALNPLGNSEAVDDLKETQAIDRQILAEKIQLQQSLAAIDKASGNDKEYAKDQEKLHELQQQSNQQQIQQNLQLTQTLRTQWQSYFSIVNQGVTQGINGLISGNETFEQASRQMLVRLLEAFADYYAQKLMLSAENWLEDAVLGKTTQSTNAEMQVASNAAVAASAAFASTAAIPIVGAALAPEAAASTYATVLGTYGPLATFETGGIVPSTGIALVHANEGVLTAPQTQWLQSMAQGSGGGGTANINTTINNQGLTDSSFQAMATKHAGHITRTVLKGMRNANLV